MAEAPLKPIAFHRSLVLFGAPGLLIWIGVHLAVPALAERGLHPGVGFVAALYGPFAAFVPLSLWLYRREGNPWRWHCFADRFRLGRLPGRTWLALVAAFVVIQLAEGALALVSHPLRSIPGVAPPGHVPIPFNGEIALPLEDFLGFGVAGNRWLLGLWALCLTANIVGEELLWRGYLLPRQELTHGRWAWLIHGLMWCFLLHLFMPWQWLAILPSNLALPWLAQHTSSFWPSFAIHGTGNALVFGLLIASF